MQGPSTVRLGSVPGDLKTGMFNLRVGAEVEHLKGTRTKGGRGRWHRRGLGKGAGLLGAGLVSFTQGSSCSPAAPPGAHPS